MNNYQQILERFCAVDGIREWMMTPNVVGDYVYATNSCIMAKMPRSYDPDRVESNNVSVNRSITSIKWPEHTIDIIINLSEIKEKLEKCEKELVNELKECPSCEGYGIVEWKFENHTKEGDCPECEGSGELIDYSKPKKLRYTEGQKIKILDSFFDPNIIEIIQFAIEKSGSLECKLVNQLGAEKKSYFTIGEIEIVAMPLTN